VIEHPDWIKKAIQLSTMSEGMRATARCANCHGLIERTVFNGNYCWTHIPGYPVGQHFPRTSCGNGMHAGPVIEDLMAPEDFVFLWQMQIGV